MHVAPALLLTFAALSPPSGRPPTGPLQRSEPRLYDITFAVDIGTVVQRDATYQQIMDLKDTPIVMPVIFQSTFSRVDAKSLSGRLWLGGREDLSLRARSRIDSGLPFQTHLAVFPIERFKGQAIRWQLGYRAKVWSSRLHEQGAASLTWPKEWPEEVRDGLQPQMYIESDDPMFAEAVARVSEGNLRMVPPYLAAKDLVRYCIKQVRVRGTGELREDFGFLRGLRVQGARAAAQEGLGSPHDLVCVCVATLRAAGIPARPVIGIQKKRTGDGPGSRARGSEFVTWAEFYLPRAGWIPFDPNEMRSKGIVTMDVHRPWPEFGTMDELNKRIPLAFHFLPPATVESPQAPAVWGWDPRPARPSYGTEQAIRLSITSRGRAPEDPQ